MNKAPKVGESRFIIVRASIGNKFVMFIRTF